MANQFGKVSVGITASTGGLTSGLRKASAQLDRFGSNVRAIRSRVGGLLAIQGARMFAGLVGSATRAAQSLISMGSAAAQTIDRTAKLSRQLGLTYGEMSALSLAAELSGTSMDDVSKGMLQADRRFIEAQSGLASAARGFEMAGVSLEQLQGLTSAERFRVLAEAISQLPTSAERAAAAMNVFGRSGTNMLNMFEGGGVVIGQAAEDVERFGNALTGTQAGNVEAMNDAFSRASGAVSGIVTQVTAYLAPGIKSVVDTFTEFVGTAGGANIGQSIGMALLDAAVYLAGVGDYLITNLGPTLTAAFENGSKVANFLFRVAELFRGVFNAIQVGMSAIILSFTELIELAAGLVGGSPELSAFNRQMERDMMRNAAEMQQAFGNAFGDQAEQFGEAAATPLTDLMEKARQTAIDAAQRINEGVDAKVKADVLATVEVSTQALKAVVVGTAEGEAFRNAMLRGQDPRTAAQTDQQIADNTGRTADAIDSLPDAFATSLSTQIAGASITV